MLRAIIWLLDAIEYAGECFWYWYDRQSELVQMIVAIPIVLVFALVCSISDINF